MKILALVIVLSISLAGCAGKNAFEMSKDGPTMKENYDSQLYGEGEELGAIEQRIRGRKLENDINYTNSVRRVYKRVANPELVMFIYPHRATRHGVIVPGYSFSFPMYEKVQYSLFEGSGDEY